MNIIKKTCPNFISGRKQYKPEAIVIHIMEGTLAGTDSWFGNIQSKVSAHYGVGRNGEVHQYVDENNTAWHAGRVTNPSWSLIKKVGSGLYINPNYYTVGIEHEGTVDTDWTEEMYESTSTLISDISQGWNIPIDRNHVIGHHEIYAVKACPGQKVDFDKLIELAISKSEPQTRQFVAPKKILTPVNTTTKVDINVRLAPNTKQPPVKVLKAGTYINYSGSNEQGENIRGNATWLQTTEGYWLWSGGVN
ncbi:MAG TPA: peptidoglycan recognition family protein [Bacteroidia bacterium]|nr:peptidoglycan recognition family protein [Bacteroidia bacterium]